MRRLFTALEVLGALVLVLALALAGFVGLQVRRFDASLQRVWPVPLPAVSRSTDPAVLARGEHLARSLGGCALRDCHGADLGGGRTLAMGPVGTLSGPNLTLLAQAYSDAELVRLVRHGVLRDGRSVRFMPSQEFGWLPEQDVVAIVSWLRTVPVVQRPSGPFVLGALGKVLDRLELLHLDVARRVEHGPREAPPAPEATAAYGRFIARLCTGCHGERFSGGPIPGAPSSIPPASNLTPHDTGLAAWSYADFERLATQGLRRNGRRLHDVMPSEALAHMDELERHALWAYLRSLPPRPYGQR